MRAIGLAVLGLLLAAPAMAGATGFAGSWFDFQRGLWLVIEPTGGGYRVNPVWLDRWSDGRLVNRFDGMVFAGKRVRGSLGFGGEGRPAGDEGRRRWRIEGSVKLGANIDRLDGEIRVEHAPYADPPRPSQRIELHRFDRAPTLSVLTANRPVKPKARLPRAESDREMRVAVDIQYPPQKTDIEQGAATPAFDPEPRHRALTSKLRGWWRFDRDAAW